VVCISTGIEVCYCNAMPIEWFKKNSTSSNNFCISWLVFFLQSTIEHKYVEQTSLVSTPWYLQARWIKTGVESRIKLPKCVLLVLGCIFPLSHPLSSPLLPLSLLSSLFSLRHLKCLMYWSINQMKHVDVIGYQFTTTNRFRRHIHNWFIYAHAQSSHPYRWFTTLIYYISFHSFTHFPSFKKNPPCYTIM
jgi:hypothetical protein